MTTIERSAGTVAQDEAIPRVVAIIMDGNGRWAEARGLPVADGHREVARVPVLFASWVTPCELRPLDSWVRVPLRAAELRQRVLELLNQNEPVDGSPRCRMSAQVAYRHSEAGSFASLSG